MRPTDRFRFLSVRMQPGSMVPAGSKHLLKGFWVEIMSLSHVSVCLKPGSKKPEGDGHCHSLYGGVAANNRDDI